MIGDVTTVSIIVPTHNRGTLIHRTLDALGKQTFPLDQLEVLVVADGCTDETLGILDRYNAPFRLRVIAQACQGAAAARNNGAAKARGRLLLFLDDDIEAVPQLVQEHVHAHHDRPDIVVIGYSKPVLHGRQGFFSVTLRISWENMFREMNAVGHRFTYRDLLSGNLSLTAARFNQVGGFDTSFNGCGNEDYELGVRLIASGAQFHYAPEALGYHHITVDLNGALRRKRHEGRTDLLIVRRHPQLLSTLPLADFYTSASWRRRALRALALIAPEVGDGLAGLLGALMAFCEHARLRGYWQRAFHALLRYWYWRGVAEATGTPRALASYLQEGILHVHDGDEIEIDLSEGLAAAEQRLDREQPAGVRLQYRQHAVGHIRAQPGAERLRARHLRPLLATDLLYAFLSTLLMEEAAGQTSDLEELMSMLHISSTSLTAMRR